MSACKHRWVLYERKEVHVDLGYPKYRKEWHELWYCKRCRTEETSVVDGGEFWGSMDGGPPARFRETPPSYPTHDVEGRL